MYGLKWPVKNVTMATTVMKMAVQKIVPLKLATSVRKIVWANQIVLVRQIILALGAHLVRPCRKMDLFAHCTAIVMTAPLVKALVIAIWALPEKIAANVLQDLTRPVGAAIAIAIALARNAKGVVCGAQMI